MEYQTNNRAYGGMNCTFGNGAIRAFRQYEHPTDNTDQMPLPDETNCRSLAMVYPEVQRWGATFTPDEALTVGTLFKSLDLPFLAAGNLPRGGYVR